MTATSAFSVNGTTGAKAGEYSLRIDQVATASSMTSAKLTSQEGGYTASVISGVSVSNLTSLSNGAFQGADAEGSFSFAINGVDFTFSTKDTLKTIMDKVNSSKANVTMSYSQITDSIVLSSKATGQMTGVPDPGEAPVKPADFREKPAADDPDYLAELSRWEADKAVYDETMMKPYQEAMDEYTPSKAAFDADQQKGLIVSDTSGFLGHLGMGAVVQGQNARVSINGGAVMEYESNTVTLDGVEFTFKKETAGVTHEFALVQDVQSSVDKVKGFVEEFNKLVKKLYDAFHEKKNYKYSPLTDSMKDQMSDKEIEEWEKLAKSGLLARDNRLGGLLNSLRSMISETLGGTGTLASIGIKTSGYRVGEAWSLEIDEAALTKALESDPDAVYNIFGATDRGSSAGGMVTRVSSLFDTFVAQTKSNDISNLTSGIDDYTKRIRELEDRMHIQSERYYLQYSKLETAMAQMQAQTNQLTNLFGMNNQQQR